MDVDTPYLDRLDALAAAATPGPWTYGGQGWVFAAALVPDDGRSRGMRDLLASINTDDADAEFIAAARTAVPALTAALRDARAEATDERRKKIALRIENARLREQVAVAWDEGRAAGIADVDTSGYGGIADSQNPYRAALDGGASIREVARAHGIQAGDGGEGLDILTGKRIAPEPDGGYVMAPRERIARAMYEHDPHSPRQEPWDDDGGDGPLSEVGKDYWRGKADAALAALTSDEAVREWARLFDKVAMDYAARRSAIPPSSEGLAEALRAHLTGGAS